MGEALKIPKPEQTRVNLREVFDTSRKEKYRPANMGKRLVAFAIDATAISIATQVFSILVTRKIFNGTGLEMELLKLLPALLVPVAYWTILPMKFGATPGKKMMGLRIVREDHSHNVTYSSLLYRETVGKFLSSLVFFVGYVVAFGHHERATWHDRMAKTRVVQFK